MKDLLMALCGVALVASCTEVNQFLNPSSVDVSVTNPAIDTSTTVDTPPGAVGTIALSPASLQIAVGESANVQVVVTNANGVEVPSENLSVNISDQGVLRLVEIDGRIIQFEGVATGVTSVIVSASNLQTSLVATVVP